MDEYISREALSDHVMAYGRQISWCVLREYRGVLFEIGNWVCDGKIYFVIKADGKVGECVEISAKESAADVVEVVRCKYCEYGTPLSDNPFEDETGWIECSYYGGGISNEEDHFCKHGKRKDGSKHER